MLYKFTNSHAISRHISIGIFRFYELTKYIKMEDGAGRSDLNEGSVSFPENEYGVHPERLPIASFRGVKFKCISIRPDDKYISQYFVFCMSTVMATDAISDATHLVELNEDIFETFEMLLTPREKDQQDISGHKFFSHGPVEYYNIAKHPTPLGQEKWREIYSKHSDFQHQCEYRAALFVSDDFFDRIQHEPMVSARAIYREGIKLDFDLKVVIQSGTDADGWRYIELDASEVSANLTDGPSRVIEITTSSSSAFSENRRLTIREGQ